LDERINTPLSIRKFLPFIVWLLLLAACQSKANSTFPGTILPQNHTVEISPTSSQLSAPIPPLAPQKTSRSMPGDAIEPTHWPSPQPLPTPTGIPVNSSFPELSIEIAHQSESLVFCDFEDYPGQIWLLKYPYIAAQWQISDPKNAYYQPVWSPDGTKLAAISVRLSPATKQIQYEEALESEYPENENILLINPDGFSKRQISQAYPRFQVKTSEGECLTSGLHGLLKWSFDSQWLSAEYGSFTEHIDSFISFINVNTGQHFEMKNLSADGSWALNKNTFALIDNDQKGIILVEVNDSGLRKSNFVYPSELENTVYFSNITWTDKNTIILVGVLRNFMDKYQVWELNPATSRWENLYAIGAEFVSPITSNLIALCNQTDDDHIDLLDLTTRSFPGIITEPADLDCFSTVPVFKGNHTIGLSYFSYPYATELWFSNLFGATQKVLAIEDLPFPDGYVIGSVSWRP
jgi:hypothetical protein